MIIYLLRHGETDWNAKKIIQGTKDIELNNNGINQSINAINSVQNLNLDLIITSPLKRAVQTANIISGNKIPIIEDINLIERFLGDFEGAMAGSYNHNELYNINLNYKLNNVEPVLKVMERVSNFFEYIKTSYADKKILLVTHSGTTRVIEGFFNNVDSYGNLPKETLKNCEIRKYVL